jgi:Leucine-rich repeat (LRR) protein
MAAISASTSHNLPPQGAPITADPTRLPGVLLERILFMADNTKAAATCRSFARQTDNAVGHGWRGVSTDLIGMPNPTSAKDVTAIYRAHFEKFAHAKEFLLENQTKRMSRKGFHPSHFTFLKETENTLNLMRIWSKIRNAVGLPETPMSCIEVKAWLKANAASLAKITHLDLSRLGLTMIPEEFASLALPNLESLYLDTNYLSTLPRNFACNCPKLKALSLKNNQIQQLPEHFGSCWPLITFIDLNNNKIRVIPAGHIALKVLEKINLSNNQIQHVPRGMAKYPKPFLIYFFIENPLSLELIRQSQEATRLALTPLEQSESDRNLELLWPQLCKQAKLPYTAPMTSTQIKAMLKENADIFQNVEYLDLTNLKLTMIPEEFSSLPLIRLVTLNLANNELRTLPNNFGHQWKKFRCLFIESNRLEHLPEDFGIYWREDFRHLYLSDNQLKNLPVYFGVAWISTLSSLSLLNNQIQQLPADYRFLHFERSLEGNPLGKKSPPEPKPVIAPPQTKPPQLHRSNTMLHLASTVALGLLASSIIGTKWAVAAAAIYLAHKYAKNLTPALLARPFRMCSLAGQTVLGKCRLPAMRI